MKCRPLSGLFYFVLMQCQYLDKINQTTCSIILDRSSVAFQTNCKIAKLRFTPVWSLDSRSFCFSKTNVVVAQSTEQQYAL